MGEAIVLCTNLPVDVSEESLKRLSHIFSSLGTHFIEMCYVMVVCKLRGQTIVAYGIGGRRIEGTTIIIIVCGYRKTPQQRYQSEIEA